MKSNLNITKFLL